MLNDENEKSRLGKVEVLTVAPDEYDTEKKYKSEIYASKTKSKKTTFCKKCGKEIDPETKKCKGCGKQYFNIKLIGISRIAVIVSIVLLCLNLFQLYLYYMQVQQTESYHKIVIVQDETIKNKDSSISAKDTIISEKEKKIERMQEQYDFFDRYAVVVPNNGTYYYHKYGCEDCDTSHFWIYNTEAAKDNGYKPCPKCRKAYEGIYSIDDFSNP